MFVVLVLMFFVGNTIQLPMPQRDNQGIYLLKDYCWYAYASYRFSIHPIVWFTSLTNISVEPPAEPVVKTLKEVFASTPASTQSWAGQQAYGTEQPLRNVNSKKKSVEVAQLQNVKSSVIVKNLQLEENNVSRIVVKPNG